MAITRQQKEEILKELALKFKNAKSVAFGQYAGMTVEEMQAMRGEMREAGVEFKVAKRTLFKLAAKEAGIELPEEIIEGTVGAAFSNEDIVSGPKLLKKTAKEIEPVKLLGGVMEGKVLSIDDMRELADIPSKEELLAKFVGMLSGPLQNFYGLLTGPTSSLARAFTAYADQLPAEDAPAPVPAEETAKEEVTEAPAEEAAPAVEEAPPAENPPEAKAEGDES